MSQLKVGRLSTFTRFGLRVSVPVGIDGSFADQADPARLRSNRAMAARGLIVFEFMDCKGCGMRNSSMKGIDLAGGFQSAAGNTDRVLSQDGHGDSARLAAGFESLFGDGLLSACLTRLYGLAVKPSPVADIELTPRKVLAGRLGIDPVLEPGGAGEDGAFGNHGPVATIGDDRRAALEAGALCFSPLQVSEGGLLFPVEVCGRAPAAG